MKQTTTFLTMKQNNEKITMITAYDYPSAKHCEAAATDIILVGDSLGMVVLGYDSTIPVTMDDMVHHTKAVKRGAKETFVVADMPFMSYHVSLEQTMANARRLYQEAGANAVKLEGADDVLLAIDALTKAGIPVCAHLGLTPQSVGVLGGYKVQGKDAKAAQKLIDDALKVEQAGAFMLVLECVPHQLATHIAEQLTIPVIGIGAGVDVDGQVLVYHDILRYGSHHLPKFVKAYGDVSTHIHDSLTAYNAEVKAKTFPRPEHQFTMNEETLQQLYGGK